MLLMCAKLHVYNQNEILIFEILVSQVFVDLCKIACDQSEILIFEIFVSQVFVDVCDQSDGQGRSATVASIGIRNLDSQVNRDILGSNQNGF